MGWRCLVIFTVLWLGHPARAQPSETPADPAASAATPPPPAEPPPAADERSPAHMTDGAGYLGLVLYQDRERYFDQRRFATVIGADLQRRSHSFLLRKVHFEVGGAFDRGSEQFEGFRFALSPMLGLGLGSDRNYVGICAGFGVDGDVKGAVPTALTFPVEASIISWMSSSLRGLVWARGDRFIGAQPTRRAEARDIIMNELSAGARLVIMLESKRQKQKGEEMRVRRGIAIGVSGHQTMGSTVWTLQLGMGANLVPQQN